MATHGELALWGSSCCYALEELIARARRNVCMCVGCLNSALPHQTILHTTTLKKRSGQSNGAVIWVSRCAGGRHAVVVAIATWVIALHVAMGDACNESVWQHLLHARGVRPSLTTCTFPTIRTLIMAISR